MKSYKDELEMLRFSRQQKNEMIEFLAQNAGQQPENRVRRFRPHRTAAVAVAAAVCLTATAFALPNSPLRKLASEAFVGIFGSSTRADGIGASLGIPVTADGITVTADAVIGDATNLCIVYTIQKEDGTPLTGTGEEKHLMFKQDDTFTGLARMFSSGSHGSSYFTDNDPADGALQYVQMLSVDGAPRDSLLGKRLSVSLGELTYWDDTKGGTALAAGPWQFKLPLEYTDTTRQLPSGQLVSLAGQTFTITEAAISPIGYSFRLESRDAIPFEPNSSPDVTAAPTGGGVEILEDGSERPLSGGAADHDSRQPYFDAFTALLILADGSTVDFRYSGGGMSNLKDGRLVITKSGTFEDILSPDDMTSLTICGADIPLS